MNSNRLHNIFNSKRKLSREEIQSYGQSEDALFKNAIEQKSMSDSFDGDALEGWGELSYNTSVLKKLDKKFSGSSNATWLWIGGVITIGAIALLIFNPFGNEPGEKSLAVNEKVAKNETPSKIQVMTFDESDIILSESIEEMKIVSLEKQIQPKKIKEDFAEMILIHETEKIEPLPLIVLEENKKENHLVSVRKLAKEIYLSDLKLIDYRTYRSNPTIQVKQIILSGTPANKEDKYTDDIETSWKTVDVPYMDYIEKSLHIFNKGNYKKALSRFETILASYPDDVNANFYAGLCLYNFGEYDAAYKSFSRCIDGPFSNFDEESLWMKALSCERLDKNSEAIRLFKEIEKSNGFYANQAKSKLMK